MLTLGSLPRSVGELAARFLSFATSPLSVIHPERDGHARATAKEDPGEKRHGVEVLPASYKSQDRPSNSNSKKQEGRPVKPSNPLHRLFSRRQLPGEPSAKNSPARMDSPISKPPGTEDDPITSPMPSENAHSRSLIDVAEHLCSKYGTVGLSAGLLEGGNTFNFNIGSLDLPGGAAGRPTSHDSMYLISSLTKPIFTLAAAIMVNDSQYTIDFTTEVKDIFPELADRTFLRHAGRQLTVVDLLDNHTEFPRCTNLWESPNGIVPWKDSAPVLSVLRHLPRNEKFEDPASFIHARNYSNEGFALAAAILEKKTGIPWAKFVRQKILEPLGMECTVAGLTSSDKRTHAERLAKSFSASIGEHIKALQGWGRGESEVADCKRSFRYVRDVLGTVTPIEVAPSRAPEAEDGLASTPIAAAAGIVSSVSDLLKFYAKFIEVYHLPRHKKSGTNFAALSEVERGIVTVQGHVQDMVENKTCAYAAGWSTAMVPWNPDQFPRPRWPGEDGDNARWMNKTTIRSCSGADDLEADWPFFQRTDAEESQRLVLNHGGNMIGATSFCLVDLERKRAAVVLTNTRGYMVDCANFVGMLLSTHGDPKFIEQCEKVKSLACLVASKYLLEVRKYEEELSRGYPSWPIPDSFPGCVGTYELTEGIFVTISVRELDKRLLFRLYGEGYPYALRLRRGATPTARMSFATSMAEILPTGIGGNNRLDPKGFEIELRNRDAASGLFQELIWDFSMTGKAFSDPNVGRLYTFKRIPDRA